VIDRNPRRPNAVPASGEANVFAPADVFARPAAPQATDRRTPTAGDAALDPSAIMASIGEVPYTWTLSTDALVWGGNAAAVLGVPDPAALATGRGYAMLQAPDATATRFDAIAKSAARDTGVGVAYQIQYALKPPGGDAAVWVEDTGRWFAGADGAPAFAHGILRVINERHEQEEKLAFLSRFDGLTGEMNRFRLAEVLTATLDDAIQQRGSCGFMLVAIDNLARINEAYGFDIADEVIGAVAKRLRAKMRGGDHLGRFSGNKFGIILNNCTPEDMDVAADRLLSGVRDDVVRSSSGPVAVTVTIGGITAPRHARDVQEVLTRAQEVLAQAKAKRRGSFQAYRPNVEREALRRENVRAADEIVSALNERRILLAFEPVVDTITRQPTFYECLMRIRGADGRIVPAGQVIPVAERLGLVRMIDHRVLELLVSEMAAVPALNASINVSPTSTIDPDWWSALTALLRANAGVAERLTVEITEMTAIQDVDDTRGFVARVKDLGCRIAIDDFGSGYTSFRNLRKLGVDVLKIDGAFVQAMTRSDDDRVFVQTLIELARRLGLRTVAEWVQDEEAAALLAEWGCDCLQGRLIGLASIERPWGEVVPVDRRKSVRV
jgi:diguanylate cyclase (GGDEF)-like protein